MRGGFHSTGLKYPASHAVGPGHDPGNIIDAFERASTVGNQ